VEEHGNDEKTIYMLKGVVVNINILSVRGKCTCISLVGIEGYQDMLWVRGERFQRHLQNQTLDLNRLNDDNAGGSSLVTASRTKERLFEDLQKSRGLDERGFSGV
jgi:hypothetical protein